MLRSSWTFCGCSAALSRARVRRTAGTFTAPMVPSEPGHSTAHSDTLNVNAVGGGYGQKALPSDPVTPPNTASR
ncbi:hypothetical protein GCM10027200_00870 [Lentzea nigeriaca]